jgi:putative DNA-invertase from lambdoid prophage Rac
LKAAIWARVSTDDQHTENQLEQLRVWADRRGLEVVREFITEDSAWAANGGNGKGAEFDRKRNELINCARLGHYQVVLIWALDRLSRRGIEDTLNVLRRLAEHQADVWSLQEDWLRTSDPAMRELLIGIFGWMAGQESKRRSERIKAGLARRKAEGKPVGGRRRGSKDKRSRAREGYVAAWSEGGKRRLAAAEESA